MKLKLPGGLQIPFETSQEAPGAHEESDLEASIRDMISTRVEQLEEFTKLLIAQMGENAIRDYELIEDWSEPKKVRWYFSKRKPPPSSN